MAEAAANPTLTALDQLQEQNIQALKARIEQERQARLAAARGQAISRGLQGSSFETRATSEVNRLADEALNSGERDIRSQFANQRLQLEEQELTRQWQSLEEEKNRAFNAGEQEKARQFEQQQADLERNAQEMMSRREGRAALANTGAQIGTLALLNRGPLFGGGAGGAAGAGGASTPGVFTTALNKAGQGLFGTGANPAGGAAGPALPTFGQGFRMPFAQGVAPGGAGIVGQVAGGVAGTAGGAMVGQRVADSLFGQSYNNDKAVSRGGKAGSLVGAGIGTYFGGPVGGAIGGTVGGAIGANVGQGLRAVSSAGAGASSNQGITFENIARGAARKPLEAIGGLIGGGAGVKAVQGVKNTVRKLFCFLPDTPIEMEDGSEKPIGELKIGDMTKGGVVESVRVAIADDLFNYEGVNVTSGHAVLEDGKVWKRVGKSKNAYPVPGTYEIISIVTTKHRVYSKGVTFSDEFETELYEWLDLDESLHALNKEQELINGAATV